MSAAPGIFQKLFTSAGDFAKRHKLEKAWQFLQGEHPWVVPAFVAAGSAPVLGLILEQRNKDEQARRQGLAQYPYRPAYYPDQGEGAVLEARRAVKEALDKSVSELAQPKTDDGLNHLREVLRKAKSRSGQSGAEASPRGL
jgi:hypothetical protein